MHPSLALVEEALALVTLEEEALQKRDIDSFDELSTKRVSLQEKAWDIREGCDEAELAVSLQRLYKAAKRVESLIVVAQKEIQRQLYSVNTNRKTIGSYGTATEPLKQMYQIVSKHL